MTGFLNPATSLFDPDDATLAVRYGVPYSDLESLPSEKRQLLLDKGEPIIWSHTLTDLLGGQLEAGLVLTDLVEDGWSDHPLSKWMPTLISTRAVRDGAAARKGRPQS